MVRAASSVEKRGPEPRTPAWAVIVAVPLWLVAFGTTGANAQGTPSGGAAQVPGAIHGFELSVDLPLTLASAVIGSSWLLRSELAAPDCAPRCNRDDLPALDRGVAGRFDPGARRFSDFGVAGLLAGSSALLLVDGGIVDFAIGVQAVLATSAFSVLTMMAVRRPRPFLYGEEAPLGARLSGNAGLAFPSGHTANAFAATFALFQTLRSRHPDSPWIWVALAGGCTLAGAVGASRVLAGDHFPSDVIAGAVLGSAIGWVVPELHRIAPGLSISPSAGGLATSGSW
jgi:membrane-associated phospholipid phosphatase